MELNMKNFQLLAYLSIAAGVFANTDLSHLKAEIQALKQGTSLKSALPHPPNSRIALRSFLFILTSIKRQLLQLPFFLALCSLF